MKRDVPGGMGGTKLFLEGAVAMDLEADVPNIIAANPTIDQVGDTNHHAGRRKVGNGRRSSMKGVGRADFAC